MPNNEVEKLEVVIDTSAKSANRSLGAMETHLEKIAENLTLVTGLTKGLYNIGSVDVSGLKELKSDLDAIFKKQKNVNKEPTKPRVDRSDLQYTAKSFDELLKKFKDVGKGMNLSGKPFIELEKEVKKSESQLSNLQSRLQKKLATENVTNYGKAYVSLAYDIQKAKNEIEQYKAAMDKIDNNFSFTVNTGKSENTRKYSASKNTPKISDSSISSENELKNLVSQSQNFSQSALSTNQIDAMNEALKEVVSQSKTASEEVSKSVETVKVEMDSIGDSTGLEKLYSQFDKLKAKSKQFKDEIMADGWKKAPFNFADKLIEMGKIDKGNESGSKYPETQSYDDFTQEEASAASYEEQIKSLKKELEDLRSSGQGQGDAGYDAKAQELATTEERLKSYKKELKNTAKETINLEGLTKFNKFAMGASIAAKGVKKLASAASSAGKAIKNILLDNVKKIASVMKKPLSAINNLRKSLSGLKKQKGMSWGRMLGSSILFSTIFGMISTIKNAVKEGSDNLVQYSSEYNNSISSMVSSLSYMKNAWAAAFSPIINVVAPYISAFIDMLSQALNKIGQFFSALTGKSTAVQATKNWTDYGKSLSETGKSAKKAGQDAKKAAKDFQTYTLGIDELNVQPQQSSSSSSGDSNSGSGTSSGISPSDMFTTVDVESGVSDFTQKVKDAWAKADFTEIGLIIGEKFKSALDSINWEPIQQTAIKIGASIGTFITGFVSVDGLGTSIGSTLGEAINTGVGGVNAFLDNTKWQSVGNFIGEGLNGVVDSVQWDGIGHLFAEKWNAIFDVFGGMADSVSGFGLGTALSTMVNNAISDFNWSANATSLSNFAKKFLDTIVTFIEKTNWKDLGKGIADFVGSIDYSGIIQRLAEGLGAAIGGLASFLWGLIEDAWSSVVQWWKDTAFEDGQFTIAGLLEGIWESIKNIGSWIVDHIFSPFIDGFKNAFGIHSPSTVMSEMGGYIMQGLYDGISAMFSGIVEFFSDLWESIKEVYADVKEYFKEKFGGAYEGIKEAWSYVTGYFGEIYSEVKKIFKDPAGYFREKFTSAYKAVKTSFAPIVEYFSGKWEAVKKIFSVKNVQEFFRDGFQKAYNTVTDIWDDLTGFFKKLAKNAFSPIKKLVNGIIKGINWVLKTVGSKTRLDSWSPDFDTFAKGSNGLSHNTMGIVNDQKGSTYKELIVPPNGKPFIPEGRNVMLPLQKGTKIMPANQTKKLVEATGGVPKFAGGIGDFFGDAWSAIKSFSGNVLDYLTHPGDIVKIAIDKFTDMSDMVEPWLSVAKGAVDQVLGGITDFIKDIFDKVGGQGVEGAVRWAINIANDNSHGYDQRNRWGNPDYDCSALVISAFQQAGIPLKSAGANYTGNIYDAARSVGFADVTGGVNRANADGMRRGDILLSRGHHTAIYIGNGQVVQASSNEHGGITGGQPGDQNGREIWVTRYYNFPWTDVLRYAKFKNGIGKILPSDLVPAFANGGFPEDGLFMANHSELVGQFSNGKTAVANNDQIVTGIENGVYRGMMRAQSEDTEVTSLLGEILTAIKDGKKIVVDGRELVSIYDNRKSRNGFSFT